MQRLDTPSRGFPSAFGDLVEGVELYEEDDEFVLTFDMPGFERDEITGNGDEGVLYVSGEHEEPSRNQRETVHRSFRFPKGVDPDEIAARYQNGVHEIRLPIAAFPVRGQEIVVTG